MNRDFKDLLSEFCAKGVEFLIVGAYALAFHGAPRFTGDLDILVRPALDNAARLLTAQQTRRRSSERSRRYRRTQAG